MLQLFNFIIFRSDEWIRDAGGMGQMCPAGVRRNSHRFVDWMSHWSAGSNTIAAFPQRWPTQRIQRQCSQSMDGNRKSEVIKNSTFLWMLYSTNIYEMKRYIINKNSIEFVLVDFTNFLEVQFELNLLTKSIKTCNLQLTSVYTSV